jgi:phospholipid N-methyltransferase
MLARGRSYASFLGAFLRAHKTVGAIAPTSGYVARRMAALAGVAQARSVAELGPGTGAITQHLLAALPADGRLQAYEVFPQFVEHLRATIDDPRFTLVADSAETIVAASPAAGGAGFDAIVCSIPFSLLTPAQTTAILRASALALRPGGTFVALQYHPTYLAPLLRKVFRTVERHVAPWNIPPALLLRARDPLPPA